jgi:PAS domain S-box-containing protein
MRPLFRNEHETATAVLQLELQQLNRLFPHYLVIDNSMAVIQCSTSVAGLCTDICAASLLNIFSVTDNEIVITDFDTLTEYITKPLTLVNTNLKLKGHFELINGSGDLLFVGSVLCDKKDGTAVNGTRSAFGSLLDNIDDNVWQHDFRTEITTFSKTQTELLGSSDEDDNVKLWWDSVHPDDKQILQQNDRKYRNAVIDHHALEYRLLCKDGSSKWVLDRGNVVEKASDGRPLRIVGTHTDITSIKQAQVALAESEMRFKDLAQNVPGVVYQWEERSDGSYGFTYVSPKLQDYFGVPPSAMNTIADMLHPDDKERWRTSIDLANAGNGIWEFEGRLLYPDGHIKWWRGASIRSEKKDGNHIYNGIMLDITAQKEAEIKIRKAEQLYKFAVEGTGDGVWEYDFLTGNAFYSIQFKRLLGYADDEYANDADVWLRHVHPSDMDTTMARRDGYLKGEIERHSAEYRIRCKNGNYIWILDRGMIIDRSGDGSAKKIIGTISDITKRKELEAELETTANRFSNLISSLNDGIIVEDEDRHIVLTNQKFCDMFDITFRSKVLTGMACKDAIRHCAKLIKKPGNFEGIIEEFIASRKDISSIILELNNGRTYEMDCVPIFIEGQYKGHLWKYTDITDRILADNKLEAQKKFYEDLLNEIPAEIAVLNEHREYLYINPYAVRNNDLRKWLIGKKDEDFCKYRNKPEELAQGRKDLFNAVLQAGNKMQWEEKILKEGKTLHYLRNLCPVINKDGNVKFMIGYGIDITERKNFEERLSLSEKRYRDLFNYSHALICIHDTKGLIITINPAVCKLLGYEQDEMTGKYIYDFIPVDELALFKEKYLNAFTHADHAKGVFSVVSKSGNIKYLLYQNYKVEEPGKEPYIIGFSHDITERKKIEEAIRSGEEKYRSIIENMNLGLVELDKSSTIIFTNENLSKMSGYAMDELIGQKLYNVFSAGESRHFIKQKMYLKEKGVSEVYEFVTKNKKGEARWWLVSGSPLYTHTGEFKGSLAICLDITQQKALEQELRHAKQQAEQSARAKELFLANMSHEIRTPMNAILGMGKQLEKTVMDGQQQFYLHAMNSAATNLLVIINDILDFSKIEAGKMTLDSIGFELKDVANKSMQVLVHKAEEKGLALSSVIDPNIAPILIGDPYRINQVFINLLGNSVKFTEKGSVSIHCKVAEDNETSQLIHIEVVDSGIGMSEEFQNSLFDKFLQEDDKNGKKYSGTGLGMSIVRELVELMKGNITVDSKKNIGTIISLNIPFAKGNKNDLPKKEEKIASSNILFNKRILLVEDNEMNRVLATIVLNQYSAIVDEAVNGEEAIAAVRTNDYDIVLMDMRMPVMDGVEATQIIRNELSSTIPIIALTANAVVGEKQKCIEAGMNDFLVKPFEEEGLVQILAKWLGLRDVFKNKNEKESQQKNAALFSIENLKSISRGNKEFITKMLSVFIKEIGLALQEIRAGEQNNNIEKIKSTAHRIKPSLSNMAVDVISAEILQLEVFNFSGNQVAQLPEIINKVEEVLTDVIAQVEQLIASGEY